MTMTFDPGKQKYIFTEKVTKAKACPSCGSDRESTRKIISLSTPEGRFVKNGECTDAWHQVEFKDGRIGGASSTPSSIRRTGVPRG